MGGKPRVDRTPEESGRSCRKASRAETSRRRAGVTALLRICSMAGRIKRSKEQRPRLGEKRCRGGKREGSPHSAVGTNVGAEVATLPRSRRI
jgi:hypothetical protein